MLTERVSHLSLLADEARTIATAKQALVEDLRFEHLGDNTDDVVWRFACKCYLEKGSDHVASFVKEHTRKPIEANCFIPVEHLGVETEMAFLGIRLLPTADVRIPMASGFFSLDAPVGCVAEVETCGTHYARMAARAREVAYHALRVLRVGLHEHLDIHDRQLRFELATSYAFDDRSKGWHQRDDAAYGLKIDDKLLALALEQPIAKLPANPTNDIEQKADLALRWMERASLAREPLVALLYLFFALEALLGDASEGLKAHGLAFRQALLSHAMTDEFTHPDKTYFLYDQVRSGAVHGERTPEVDWEVVDVFSFSVRRTLGQYLTLAGTLGIVRRAKLLRSLDEHLDRPQLEVWLRENAVAEAKWDEYFTNKKAAG
jgi:hypothetical protein